MAGTSLLLIASCGLSTGVATIERLDGTESSGATAPDRWTEYRLVLDRMVTGQVAAFTSDAPTVEMVSPPLSPDQARELIDRYRQRLEVRAIELVEPADEPWILQAVHPVDGFAVPVVCIRFADLRVTGAGFSGDGGPYAIQQLYVLGADRRTDELVVIGAAVSWEGAVGSCPSAPSEADVRDVLDLPSTEDDGG